MAQPSRNRPDATTLATGAVAGLAAFAVGYVLTYAWRAPAVNDSLRGLNFLAELVGAEAIPTWKGVAWLFYGAHGVATRFPTLGGGTELVNMVEQSGDGTVALLYVLVPVLLLVAGGLAARLADADSPGEGAAAGATVVVGYVVLAAVGTVLAAHAIGDTGSGIAPDPVTGVLLAGVVYPLVFGGVGGALASYL
jgi:hypothetical protein